MPKYKVGSVPVDSGQLIIVDPMYLKNWWNKNDYPAASQITSSQKLAGMCFPGGLGRVNVALASATNGNGQFPVYIDVNEKGEVTSIEIKIKEDE